MWQNLGAKFGGKIIVKNLFQSLHFTKIIFLIIFNFHIIGIKIFFRFICLILSSIFSIIILISSDIY